jgi:hypothetical protein
MRSKGNTDWNKRTLALMASSGLLTLEGPVTSRPVHGHEAHDSDVTEDEGEAFQTVRILNPRHLDEDTWQELVAPRRTAIDQANRASLQRVEDYVRAPARICLEDRLAPLYQVSWQACGQDRAGNAINVALACGGCPACRALGRVPFAEPTDLPTIPWPDATDLMPPADRLLDRSQRLLVFYERDLDELDRRDRRTVLSAFSLLIRSGFRNVHLEQYQLDMDELWAEVKVRPMFVARGRDARFLPPGPSLVLVGRRGRVTESLLAPRSRRLVFLPADTGDLDVEGELLRRRYPHAKMWLDDLLGRLGV